jgi:Kef-type K+ transport system membrane component KefB
MSIPFSDPVLIFAAVMTLMLLAPILARRAKLPEITGLIIAGMIFGPHGLGILARDNTIVLLGTVGLLFIMFLAGLEIDLYQVRRNKNHTIVFGLLTFAIPLTMGTLLGRFAFGMTLPVAILLASMFSSHTLLTYPITLKLGLGKSPSVTTTIGGTIITDTLALLILAAIAGMSKGTVGTAFWIRLLTGMTVYAGAIIVLVPIIGRWFLRKAGADENSEFVFILAVAFLSAYLAHLAGLEPIIGAFLAGLTLNSLVPGRSLLMTRIHFSGDAIFIPFFLLSVGMLVDVTLLFTGVRAWIISIGMITVALSSKFIAAWLSAKLLHYEKDEGQLMFGLSVNQAAATLAAVLVGFNLGLFDEAVITGTVMMIAVSCITGSFVSGRAGRSIALRETQKAFTAGASAAHRIMIPFQKREGARELIDIAFLLRENGSQEPLYPVCVAVEEKDPQRAVTAAEKVLDHTAVRIMAAGYSAMPLTVVDVNVADGILRSMKNYRISLLLMGWKGYGTKRHAFGRQIDAIIGRSTQLIFINRITRPVGTATRMVLLLPPFTNRHIGFDSLIAMIKNLSHQTGTRLHVFTSEAACDHCRERIERIRPDVPTTFENYNNWRSITSVLVTTITADDWLCMMSSRKGEIAWQPFLDKLPSKLARLFPETLFSVAIAPSVTSDTLQTVTTVPSLVPSIFSSPQTLFTGQADSPQQAVSVLLQRSYSRDSQLFRDLVAELSRIAAEEPVELTKDVVLLHTYNSSIATTMVFLGVFSTPLDIPLASSKPNILIILLDPESGDPAGHIGALVDIARLLRLPGIVELLNESKDFEEFTQRIGRIK